MAISLVTGPLGTGKSFYGIRKAVDALEADKVVVTNFRMTPDWTDRVVDRHPLRYVIPGRRSKLKDRWRRSTMVAPDIETLTKIRLQGEGEGRGVVILDEVHRWMNARTWNDDDRLKIVEWFSLSRKLGWDVYMLTQDAKNVDRQVRDLFEYHITLRNLRKMKVAGVPVSPINLFLAIWQWHAASKAVVKREMYKLNWTKGLYDTFDTASFGRDAIPDDAIWLPQPPSSTAPSATATASASTAAGGAAPRRDDLERSRRRLVELGRVISDRDSVSDRQGQESWPEGAGSSNSPSGPVFRTDEDS